MKEVIETKMIEQTTHKWVADDGTEFDDSWKCTQYERKQNREKAEKMSSRYLVGEYDLPFADWNNDEFTVRVYALPDRDAMEWVRAYYDAYSCDNEIEFDNIDEYPAVLMTAGDDGYVSTPNHTPGSLAEQLEAAAKKAKKIEEAVNKKMDEYEGE